MSAPFVKQHGYYGLDTGLGCLPCNCSPSGSLSEACTEEGQCHCVPGVAGKRCDRCARGFYAFQDGGCTRKLLNSSLRLYRIPQTFLWALPRLLSLWSAFPFSLFNMQDSIPLLWFPILGTCITFGQVLLMMWAYIHYLAWLSCSFLLWKMEKLIIVFHAGVIFKVVHSL